MPRRQRRRGAGLACAILEPPPLGKPQRDRESSIAVRAGCALPVVIELDTGGGRCGVQTPADALALGQHIHGLPGLGDADPERLFARFEQGPRSPYTGEQGFGLGLHIVASYVRLLGGTVTAADRPRGGACFTVRFPESPEET